MIQPHYKLAMVKLIKRFRSICCNHNYHHKLWLKNISNHSYRKGCGVNPPYKDGKQFLWWSAAVAQRPSHYLESSELGFNPSGTVTVSEYTGLNSKTLRSVKACVLLIMLRQQIMTLNLTIALTGFLHHPSLKH